MENQQTWWVSSTGAGLALRVKAILIGLLPVIVLILKLVGVNISESDLVNIISGIVEIIAIVAFIYGLVRKNFNKQNRLGKYQ